MNWWYVLEGAMISWPPAALALWFGRRKLHKVTASQTSHLTKVTDEQTEWLRPGWRERNRRP